MWNGRTRHSVDQNMRRNGREESTWDFLQKNSLCITVRLSVLLPHHYRMSETVAGFVLWKFHLHFSALVCCFGDSFLDPNPFASKIAKVQCWSLCSNLQDVKRDLLSLLELETGYQMDMKCYHFSQSPCHAIQSNRMEEDVHTCYASHRHSSISIFPSLPIHSSLVCVSPKCAKDQPKQKQRKGRHETRRDTRMCVHNNLFLMAFVWWNVTCGSLFRFHISVMNGRESRDMRHEEGMLFPLFFLPHVFRVATNCS